MYAVDLGGHHVSDGTGALNGGRLRSSATLKHLAAMQARFAFSRAIG